MATGITEQVDRFTRRQYGAVQRVTIEDIYRWIRRGTKQIIVPLIVLLILWEILAWYIANPFRMPTPAMTFAQSFELIVQEDFRGLTAFDHIWATFVRAMIASFIAISISVLFGILMATNKTVEESLSNILPFWMTTPTVVIVLLAMAWFSFREPAVYFAVVIAATPFAIVNMWEGARAVDVDLVEMAYAYDASTRSIWRHIFLPHLLPYFFGSYRYIMGMVWKIVVLAEVFGRQEGIGAMFRWWWVQGEVVMLLAYLMFFVVIVLTIEYAVLKPAEDYLFRWRE